MRNGVLGNMSTGQFFLMLAMGAVGAGVVGCVNWVKKKVNDLDKKNREKR